MALLRLIQLTDLHLYSDHSSLINGVNPAKSFKKVLEAALSQRPDYIIITGDVAMEKISCVYEWVARVMDETDVPWSWLPGNHDDISLMTSHFKRVVIQRDWRFIQLNSQVEGEGRGYLCSDEIAFLTKTLSQDDQTKTLIHVHHHVKPIGSCIDDSMLNSEPLFELLKKYVCVAGVIHGHIHQRWEGESYNVRIFGTPSTCVQFKPCADKFLMDTERSPGYRLFDLGSQGVVRSEVCRIFGKNLIASSATPDFWRS